MHLDWRRVDLLKLGAFWQSRTRIYLLATSQREVPRGEPQPVLGVLQLKLLGFESLDWQDALIVLQPASDWKVSYIEALQDWRGMLLAALQQGKGELDG